MPGSYDLNPQDNMFVAARFTTTLGSDGTKTSVQSYNYDRNGNLLELKEWDWQPGVVSSVPAGPVSRKTTHTYARNTLSFTRDPEAGENCSGAINDSNAYWNLLSGGVLTARSSTEITGASQVLSRSEFSYDDAYNTANLTSEKRWRSRDNDGNSLSYSAPLTSSNSITVSYQYGYGGAVNQSTDANGIVSSFSVDRCPYTGADQSTHYALPSQVTRAAGTPLARTTTQTWECPSALLTDSSDPNGVNTRMVYDSIGRGTQRTQGGVRPVNTAYDEGSTPVTVTTSQTVFSTNDHFEIRKLDRRGQPYQSQANDVYVDMLAKLAVAADTKSYEAVSNPQKGSAASTDGWTRTTFDQRDRRPHRVLGLASEMIRKLAPRIPFPRRRT